ncbi:TadE/TadG family type IV pilus assembly protein [Pararhizobium sp.]|uniref:TadE/TadG family type IV pilus assembly protein n=1 Tax=Pararhizobium sp. TaxID=1977563 RepID=UPI00271B4537|nr:TadE/TadG family type IV pilus assembly protein [Pararhizobium sp.]MDO9417851.1 pilus assembly protein [Pararhizobium sp.]
MTGFSQQTVQKLAHFGRIFKRFAADQRGVGAVEFAIIAPVLLMVYIGSFEISTGFSVARKVARASSAVADLVTQGSQTTKEELDTMDDVARSIISPYDASQMKLKITGIKVIVGGAATVAWSRDETGSTPYTKNSPTTVPAELVSVGGFVVRTELVVPHQLLLFAPGLAPSSAKTINLSKTYYYRQRIGDDIACSNC